MPPQEEASPDRAEQPEALVIEDNFVAAVGLARALDDLGVGARIAGRIQTARELARDVRPKIAFVDINLAGGFEGIDFARELEALYGSTIIFVTAYGVRDLAPRLRNGRPATVLFKPVDPDSLDAALVSALAKRPKPN